MSRISHLIATFLPSIDAHCFFKILCLFTAITFPSFSHSEIHHPYLKFCDPFKGQLHISFSSINLLQLIHRQFPAPSREGYVVNSNTPFSDSLFKQIPAEFSSSSVSPEKAYAFQSNLEATEEIFQKFISGKGQLLLK